MIAMLRNKMPKHVDTGIEQRFTPYYKKLQFRSTSTRRQFEWMVNNIDKHGEIDLNTVAEMPDDILYTKLQSWINWNHGRGMAATTLSSLFNSCRSYMWHMGVKLHTMDIRENLHFPRPTYVNQMPITYNEIQRLLATSSENLGFSFWL